MMKKVAILFILSVLGVWLLQIKSKKDFRPYYLRDRIVIKPAPQSHLVIEKMNKKKRFIKSVSFDMNIIAQHKITVKLTARMNYEKQKNLRMIIRNSFGGEESDVGSNNYHFWFWSKRMNPPALFYAKHENVTKSKLKAPFHPMWIMELVGIGEIDLSGAKVISYGDKIAVIQNRISTNGKPVIKMTLIKDSVVIGHYLYNSNYQIIVSAEVSETFVTSKMHILPKKMKIIWYEEGVIMYWSMNNIRTNVAIDPQKWQMPQKKQMKELGST